MVNVNAIAPMEQPNGILSMRDQNIRVPLTKLSNVLINSLIILCCLALICMIAAVIVYAAQTREIPPAQQSNITFIVDAMVTENGENTTSMP